MRHAEAALIAAGASVDELMQRAGQGAAQWIWRVAAGRSVTVLCGPGNNGGDGYVIAESLRRRGSDVVVIAAVEAASAAAITARNLYNGVVLPASVEPQREVLVDCLYGTGLTRPLAEQQLAMLKALAASHAQIIAVDLPSGIAADTGEPLNRGLPLSDLTLALGAWKLAHFLMPTAATLGQLQLIEIGIERVTQAAQIIAKPCFSPPSADAHKYTRGLLGVICGAMPGAAVLAGLAAQGAGTGYVKLLGGGGADRSTNSEGYALQPDLVHDALTLAQALDDQRFGALLLGPGLGRNETAGEALALVLARPVPTVLDADALILLKPAMLIARTAPLIVTPHGGELATLEQAFGLSGDGTKLGRALALAQTGNLIVVAKGADTVIAAPDGRATLSQLGSSWLSTAGTGDVLAGTIASRLASGADVFEAACEGVWLHGHAARLCPAPFTAGQLAARVRSAYAACL